MFDRNEANVKIENNFEVPLAVEEAWALLTDIQRIAPCMPGAELTEVIDERSYKGKVAVRLGPVALSFSGSARFEEIDDALHRARVKASGTDGKGRGGAQADVTFELRPQEAATQVLISTDLSLSGAVAQYGRGSGMIADLSSHLVSQFADCLKQELATVPRGAPSDEPATAPSTPPQAAAPISGLRLGLRMVWMAIQRGVRRLVAHS